MITRFLASLRPMICRNRRSLPIKMVASAAEKFLRARHDEGRSDRGGRVAVTSHKDHDTTDASAPAFLKIDVEGHDGAVILV